MVTVLYFASIREAVQCREEQIELNETHSSISDLRDLLLLRHPNVLLLKTIQVAVNEVYVHDETRILISSDAIAFIPPISGG